MFAFGSRNFLKFFIFSLSEVRRPAEKNKHSLFT